MRKLARRQRNPHQQNPEPRNRGSSPVAPHSGAWIGALAQTSPLQAAYVSELLNQTGRLDACTVCGDRPAPIYDDVEQPYLPVRLCADCFEFQTAVFQRHLRLRETTDPDGN